MTESTVFIVVDLSEYLEEMEAALEKQFSNWDTLTFYGVEYCEVAV